MQVNDFYLHVQRTERPSDADPKVKVPATVVSIYSLTDYRNTKNITELVETTTPKATGMARLSPRDQMNKRRGLLIAGGRAAKELGLKFTFARYNVFDADGATTAVVGEYSLDPINESTAKAQPFPMAEGKNAGYMLKK